MKIVKGGLKHRFVIIGEIAFVQDIKQATSSPKIDQTSEVVGVINRFVARIEFDKSFDRYHGRIRLVELIIGVSDIELRLGGVFAEGKTGF